MYIQERKENKYLYNQRININPCVVGVIAFVSLVVIGDVHKHYIHLFML